MPLAAYFRNVGAALFALLLFADFYLPTRPVPQKVAANPPVIRIYSDRKPAQSVDLDTTQILMAAAAPAPWDRNPPARAARVISNNLIDVSGVRDALASYREVPVEKRRQSTRKHAARGATRYAQPQIVLAARPPQFSWFGVRHW
jgi:hypothetical protein